MNTANPTQEEAQRLQAAWATWCDIFDIDNSEPRTTESVRGSLREVLANTDPLLRDLFFSVCEPGVDRDIGLWEATEPPEPCPYKPGTPEKVNVLAKRMQAGQLLWHEQDGTRP